VCSSDLVARMVTEGWPNKKIASKLFISEGTAKLHLHHIYQKLNCPGRMSLQRYMQENGLA
jgi:DNA-binding NarL/FixJ family response regulator